MEVWFRVKPITETKGSQISKVKAQLTKFYVLGWEVNSLSLNKQKYLKCFILKHGIH